MSRGIYLIDNLKLKIKKIKAEAFISAHSGELKGRKEDRSRNSGARRHR